jgi:Glycosyltransferase sugar-binding region containing DXD motif
MEPNKIPTIIHQTWKTNSIPSEYAPWVKSWITHHPDWTYMFWTDVANRAFIEKEYPEHLHMYDSYPKNIQRVDFVRVLYMYHYGGLYVDLDFECYRSHASLLADRSLILASEPVEHAKLQKRNRMLCNAWMASVPKHPFWLAVLHEMHTRSYSQSVLSSTGPILLDDIFTYVYRQGYNDHIYNITLIPSELLYSLNKHSHTSQEYARHHWKNSWVNTKKISFPKVPGYDFYPSLDDQTEGKTDIYPNIQAAMRRVDQLHKDGFFTNGKSFYVRNIESKDPTVLRAQWPAHVGGWYRKRYMEIYPTLEGYDCLPMFDAPGNDLCIRKTNNIALLKKMADSCPAIIGFNTDGAFKFAYPNLQMQRHAIPGSICFYRKQQRKPYEIIPGYLFYPHIDSPGHDVERYIQTSLIKAKTDMWTLDPLDMVNLEEVKKLIEKLKDKPYCMAFNLDGHIKSQVQPINKWITYHPFALQGLIVKK